MAKVYLAFELSEFDVYNMQAFASKADRKTYLRNMSKQGFDESDFELKDAPVDTVSDCVWVAIQSSNYCVLNLQVFTVEKEAVDFIAKHNTADFDSRNYALLTVAVQRPRD